MCTFALAFRKVRVGRTSKRGLRGAKLLGNANNNAPSNANANWGAFLYKDLLR